MRKIFFVGILAIASIGSTSAQTASECGGIYGGSASCRFACSEGDWIVISGLAGCDIECKLTCSCWFRSRVTVDASCGGASVQCSDLGSLDWTSACTAQSEMSVAGDDENGSCTVSNEMGTGGTYNCRSVTPEEAAKLEASGQGIVIKIPKK